MGTAPGVGIVGGSSLTAPEVLARNEELVPFVPALALDWVRRFGSGRRHVVLDGSLLFADITGFTPLSERLAAYGRVGAEEVSDLVHDVFGNLLRVAYDHGGDLLKFGGDALLLLFEGPEHALRSARAAAVMRHRLRALADLRSSAGRVRLQMRQGVYTGPIDAFLVGGSHQELVITGPAATAVLALESSAEGGQIVVSSGTARCLPEASLGDRRAGGYLLSRSPRGPASPGPAEGSTERHGRIQDVETYLPTAVRGHLGAGGTRAEHRQAIVAFVAFSGTEELLTRDGGEACASALHELLTVAQDAADEHRLALLGSDVAPDGGKLILVAGSPVSHPDDPDRLLRTARQVVAASVPLEVQVGVNGGSVFSGIVGPAFRRTYTVMGDTVNLAARLAGQAPAGGVLAAQEVTERTRLRFDLGPVVPLVLKGKREPVPTVTVGHRQGVRVEQRPQLPLIGRQDELGVLEDELRATDAGSGRVVELIGPPGIGKSRLVHELRERHPEMRLHYANCDPYEVATPYYPFRELLRFLLDTGRDEERPLRAAIDSVDAALVPWAPLIGSVIDVPTAPTAEVEALDPRFRTVRLHEVVGALLTGLLPERALIRIEDIHWIDAASGALLEYLSRYVIPGRSWLLIASTREPSLDGVAHRQLELAPLAPAEVQRFAHTAASEGFVALDRATELAGKASGNPLFLEQLLTYGQLAADDIPDSVERLIAARLDRLPSEQRDLLRHASLLGTRFQLELLRSVTGTGVDDDDMASLAEFVRRDPDGTYVFEHDLFRDVAYAGLPYRLRRQLHDRVARILETRSMGRTEGAAEILALHYHRAGRYEKSWEYTRAAARRASERAATESAVRFLRWSLDAAGRIASVDPGELVATWTALGDHLETMGAYGQAEHAYRRARRLALEPQRPPLWYRSGIIREREGRYSKALWWYGRAANVLGSGDEREDRILWARARLRRAEVYLHQGRTARALREARDLLPVVEATGDVELDARAHFVLGWALRTAPEGDDHRHEALTLYERLNDLGGQAIVHIDLGVAAYYRGAWGKAVEHYERARDLKDRIGDSVAAAISISNIGEIRSDQGRLPEAEDAFTNALLVFRAAGFSIGTGVAIGNLGRAASRSGRFDVATDRLEEALEIFQGIGSSSFATEMRARQAELLVFQDEVGEAAERAREVIADLDGRDPVPADAIAARVLGVALARTGDLLGADEMLHAARGHAETVGSAYDIALAEAALGWALSSAGADSRSARIHTASADRTLRSLDVTVPALRLVLGPAAHP
ncbi:MAG: tetratricopeptide repeat protein [Actinobacteria bacterium]|nr:tetratricopeptide repeat protein [Actinomycetota bacterium]